MARTTTRRSPTNLGPSTLGGCEQWTAGAGAIRCMNIDAPPWWRTRTRTSLFSDLGGRRVFSHHRAPRAPRAWRSHFYPLLLLACPLMHLFMHGGHGRGDQNSERDGTASCTDRSEREGRHDPRFFVIRIVGPRDPQFHRLYFLRIQLRPASDQAQLAFVQRVRRLPRGAVHRKWYGFPLTIYLLSGWLQSRFPNVDWFSHDAAICLEMMFGWRAHPHRPVSSLELRLHRWRLLADLSRLASALPSGQRENGWPTPASTRVRLAI